MTADHQPTTATQAPAQTFTLSPYMGHICCTTERGCTCKAHGDALRELDATRADLAKAETAACEQIDHLNDDLAASRARERALREIMERAERLWESLFDKQAPIKLPGQVLIHALNLGQSIVDYRQALDAAPPPPAADAVAERWRPYMEPRQTPRDGEPKDEPPLESDDDQRGGQGDG